MRILEWSNSMELEPSEGVGNLIKGLSEDTINTDEIKTKDALDLIEFKLLGDYHSVVIRRDTDVLIDAEIYILTWDGEASDGGEMGRLDWLKLRDIALKES